MKQTYFYELAQTGIVCLSSRVFAELAATAHSRTVWQKCNAPIRDKVNMSQVAFLSREQGKHDLGQSLIYVKYGFNVAAIFLFLRSLQPH